jgi:hypothetical protein
VASAGKSLTRRHSPKEGSGYVVTLRPLPGTDPIKALRWILKSALRKHGMKCTDLHEAAGAAELITPISPIEKAG